MQKDSDSMQPSLRETRVALTELHMGQYSTYNWRDEEESSWSPWFPCHSSVTVVKEKKDQITPMSVAYGDVEGSSALSNILSFILGNGHLNSKVNVSRILMTNMNQNWSLPFHTKLCCLSLRCENNMWPGLSIWSEYFYEPLTESRASKL